MSSQINNQRQGCVQLGSIFQTLWQISLTLFLALTLFSFQLSGQTTVPSENNLGRIINEEIIFDFKNGTLSEKALPFDVPFIIKGNVPKEIVEVHLTIINRKFLSIKPGECYPKCKSCHCKSLNKKEFKELIKQQQRIDSLKEITNQKIKSENNDLTLSEIDRFKTKLIELQAKQDSLDGHCTKSSDYNCNECLNQINFRTCRKICPWKLNFLNKATGDAEINHFSLRIPPLKANEPYEFFFEFKRSTTQEKTQIVNRLAPVIGASFFEKYNADTIDFSTTFINKLQTQMREDVEAYYRENFQMEIEINKQYNQPLNPVNQSRFKNELTNTTINGENISDLYYMRFANTLSNITKIEIPKADTFWSQIIRNNTYKVLMQSILALPTSDADDKALLSQLSDINIDQFLRHRMIAGRSTLTNPFDSKSALPEVRKSVEINIYISNISALQTHLESLYRSLKLLIINKTKRRKILLGQTDFDTLTSLLAKKDRTKEDQLKIDELVLRDVQNAKAIEALLVDDGLIIKLSSQLEDIKNELIEHGTYLGKMEKYFELVADKSFDNISFDIQSGLTTIADYKTRTGYYVTADVGLAHIIYRERFGNELIPYFGVSFHLGPINKQRKYNVWGKCNSWNSLWKNTSVVLGITTSSLDFENSREDTFGEFTLLTGVGLRIFDPVRISSGLAWNKVSDPNPLVTNKSLKAFAYFSVSFDLDVGKYLGKLGSSIFGPLD